jgi:hypothetical protein
MTTHVGRQEGGYVTIAVPGPQHGAATPPWGIQYFETKVEAAEAAETFVNRQEGLEAYVLRAEGYFFNPSKAKA